MFLWRRKPAGPLSDAELIDRYKESNDIYYVWELFERYRDKITLICLKYLKNKADSEDAVHDIFIRLVKILQSPNLEIRDFKNWILQVTKNHCLEQINKRKQRPRSVDDPENIKKIVEKIDLNNPHSRYEAKEILLHIKLAISQLEEPQRTCMEKFILEDKSYKEIEKELGYTERQVKTYIQYGLKNLRKRLSHLKD